MFKIIATAVAAAGLAVVALPAQAATGGITCDTGAAIAGSEDVISQELTAMGYTVDGIEEWNNCVRAFVVKTDGSLGMVFFEPGTLKLVGEA
ncbi:PepSY domain-containing protein [Devosia sp. Root635]|uniref:PepSY domain-containing protein n=1 Tax=Devosia sp. Root635 TaxID=1736575 RepID=UPI0006FE5E74|nr:PepSY domain-containing protein [Devosia sp. Root635]KRA42009.1 hypothetical protein ASD80_09790 [Devosia sp. Root635]